MKTQQTSGTIILAKQPTKRRVAARSVDLHRVDGLLLRGWAIYGNAGGYYRSLSPTRRDAIADHLAALGRSWEYCEAKGDRCVKVEQRPIDEAERLR